VHLRNGADADGHGAIRACLRTVAAGAVFYTFLALGIAGTVWLILSRLDYLKSEAQLESVLSRESSFMFNNLILLAACFAILWGTLFPVITEAVTNQKISVGIPFFNRINVPIALFLLLLTGVGPLIAWRRSSLESLKRAFLWPAIAGVAVAVGLAAAGMRQFYPLVSFMLCTFVLVTWGLSSPRAPTRSAPRAERIF